MVVTTGNSEAWCRVASLDAGDGRRAPFFRPEIGDEVLLGFINGDPSTPVVLGMLQSKGDRPPIIAKDENHIKGFTTRNQMHFLFDDKNKTITIDTPAGNQDSD
ncbi:MAG: phage baseplate assembly protein V [Cyclobacteriaceae bacterium]|nr:phage baseplate assembly protein V [Cyclobacteriaceae bacterium]